MSKPLYRFEMWATHRPNDRFGYTNWDHKRKITVVAPTAEEAYRDADAALGHPGDHRHWVFRVISVTDHRIPVEADVRKQIAADIEAAKNGGVGDYAYGHAAKIARGEE